MLGPQRRTGEPGRCKNTPGGHHRRPGSGPGGAFPRVRRQELRPRIRADRALRHRVRGHPSRLRPGRIRGQGAPVQPGMGAPVDGPRERGAVSGARGDRGSSRYPALRFRNARCARRQRPAARVRTRARPCRDGGGRGHPRSERGCRRRPRRRRVVGPHRSGVDRMRVRGARDERLHRRPVAGAASLAGAGRELRHRHRAARPQRAAHGAAGPARGIRDRADHRLLPARRRGAVRHRRARALVRRGRSRGRPRMCARRRSASFPSSKGSTGSTTGPAGRP